MSYFVKELGEVFVYIAYLGVGAAGKSANIHALRAKTDSATRVLSVIDANADFTKDMWDFIHPSERIRGFPIRVNLWWRHGLHFDRNAERYFLGGGLDGAVLVVDSKRERLEANKEYLLEITELAPDALWPFTVIQYNKRDLADAEPIESLQRVLNPRGLQSFEAIAQEGVGVVETLAEITSRIIAELKRAS